MHRRLTATAATAALLTLAAGCSSATPHTQAVRPAAAGPIASPTASATPGASPSSSPFPSGNPGGYLYAIRTLAKTPGHGLEVLKAMSDAQLLAVGSRACADLRKPTPPAQVEGDLDEGGNLSVVAAGSVIIAAANSMFGLCPDQNDAVNAWSAKMAQSQ